MSDGIPIHVDDVPEQRWEVGELEATRKRLGAAANALRMGVAIIEIAPGGRSTPAHAHVDEDEVFLVLEGSGVSWQSSGSKDVRAYAIGPDDVLLHPAQGDAHTLIAGDEGLKVLVVAEGSRTHLTWLPRAKQFWVGPRWSPADMPPPFAADAQLGPLEVPELSAERPPTIRNLADLPLQRGPRGQHRLRHPRRARHGLAAARARPRRDAAGHVEHRPALPLHARGVLVRARRRAGSRGSAPTRTSCAPARSGCAGPTAASGTGSRSGRRAWT